MSLSDNLPTFKKPTRDSIAIALIEQIGTVFFVTVLAGIYLIYFSSFQVPLALKVFFVGGIGGVLIAILPAKRLVDWLYNPQTVHLVSFNLTQKDYSFAIWELDYETFGEVTVKGDDYDLDAVRASKGHVYFAETFDPESLEAVGVWAGSLSSREMIVERGLIREIREELEGDAQEVFKYRSKIGSIIRQAFKEVMFDNIAAQERNTMYKGDRIAEIVQAKMADAGIDDPGEEMNTVSDKNLEGKLEVEGTPDFEPPGDGGPE